MTSYASKTEHQQKMIRDLCYRGLAVIGGGCVAAVMVDAGYALAIAVITGVICYSWAYGFLRRWIA